MNKQDCINKIKKLKEQIDTNDNSILHDSALTESEKIELYHKTNKLIDQYDDLMYKFRLKYGYYLV